MKFESAKHLLKFADETQLVRDTLIDLLKNYPTLGRKIHDVNIVATMLAYGVTDLFTLNVADFKRFSNKITILSI